MTNFDEIKEELLKGTQYYLFQLGKKVMLISKGETKTETKENFSKKVIAKPDKFKNTNYILLYFEFRIPNNKYTFGDLLVHIKHYYVTDNLSLEYNTNSQDKYVWFTKEFLEENGWSNEYLKQIAKVVNDKKIQFNLLGMPNYTSIQYE